MSERAWACRRWCGRGDDDDRQPGSTGGVIVPRVLRDVSVRNTGIELFR